MGGGVVGVSGWLWGVLVIGSNGWLWGVLVIGSNGRAYLAGQMSKV